MDTGSTDSIHKLAELVKAEYDQKIDLLVSHEMYANPALAVCLLTHLWQCSVHQASVLHAAVIPTLSYPGEGPWVDAGALGTQLLWVCQVSYCCQQCMMALVSSFSYFLWLHSGVLDPAQHMYRPRLATSCDCHMIVSGKQCWYPDWQDMERGSVQQDPGCQCSWTCSHQSGTATTASARSIDCHGIFW